jgi:hypothetical protein
VVFGSTALLAPRSPNVQPYLERPFVQLNYYQTKQRNRLEHHADTQATVYSQNLLEANYPDLSRWTKTVPNAPRSCYVTFGQGYSYFASAPGRGSVWAAIPSELSDKIQKAYDTPCCVALGVNDAWFVLWPDGYYSWKFYGGYNGLDQILTGAEPRSVSVSLQCEIVCVYGRVAHERAVSGYLAVQQGPLLCSIPQRHRTVQFHRCTARMDGADERRVCTVAGRDRPGTGCHCSATQPTLRCPATGPGFANSTWYALSAEPHHAAVPTVEHGPAFSLAADTAGVRTLCARDRTHC